jgi:hypothetical protein
VSGSLGGLRSVANANGEASNDAKTRRAAPPPGDARRTFGGTIASDLHAAFDEPPSIATVSSRRRVTLLTP